MIYHNNATLEFRNDQENATTWNFDINERGATRTRTGMSRNENAVQVCIREATPYLETVEKSGHDADEIYIRIRRVCANIHVSPKSPTANHSQLQW